MDGRGRADDADPWGKWRHCLIARMAAGVNLGEELGAMQALTEQEIHERLTTELAMLDCALETSSRGIWARRRSMRRHRPIGWRLCVYCLTLILDGTRPTVHLWDAVLEKRGGLFAPHGDAIAASGAPLIHARIERIVREAGWTLQYGLDHTPVVSPRVFRP